MADEVKSALIANLNDLDALVSSLKSGALDEVINAIRPARVNDCTGHCGCVSGMCACNNRMCGCHNTVTAREAIDLDVASFMSARAERMRELKAKLDALQLPEGSH